MDRDGDVRGQFYEWVHRSIDAICDTLCIEHRLTQHDAAALIFEAAEDWHRETLAAVTELGEGGGNA